MLRLKIYLFSGHVVALANCEAQPPSHLPINIGQRQNQQENDNPEHAVMSLKRSRKLNFGVVQSQLLNKGLVILYTV